MTKCLLRLASISLFGILTFAQPSQASPAFNDLSTNREIIRNNFNWVFLPNQKRLNFKSVGDLTLNQKTTKNKKEPPPSPRNYPTVSECRGSSRRQAKPDYPMLDFRFWISDEPCHKSKMVQD